MIQLTIFVDDITTVMSVFTHIRLYTSDDETGTYTHLDYIALAAGVSTYTYTHIEGTSDTWYKSSYWSVATESSLSDPVKGTSASLYHYPTYPEEIDFSSTELTIINKIRKLTGDNKSVERIHMDSESFNCYIKEDDKTVELDSIGWPVYITINNVEQTSLQNPWVQGYKFLTFSGTLSASNDELIIWYYNFKFSDREVYEAYDTTMIPPGLSSTTVTEDHMVLQAAIDLLENMYAEAVVDDGAVVRNDATTYDPSPGLREWDKKIERLKKRLDDLVKQYMFSSLEGILID